MEDIRYASSMQEITTLIEARVPIIWVVTHEENRFIRELEQASNKLKADLWSWTACQGLVNYKGESKHVAQATGEEKGTNNPQKALQRIIEIKPTEKSKRRMIFFMKDMHSVMVEPIPRQLRDMYDHLVGTIKSIVIVSPLIAHGPGGRESGLPPTLEKQVSVVEYGLPNFQAIKERVSACVMQMSMAQEGKPKKFKLDYSDQEFTDFAKALQGLTLLEIDNSMATCFTHLGKLDTNKLIQDKRQLIRKSQILEFIDEPTTMNDVGGLDQAKIYLQKYAQANSEEAKEFGVEPLKGILLTGIPGTGKSLLAKAIGKMWKAPLLRLDVGKVMTGLVGGSEGKMREVIAQAESMSPAILWIDEVEKSLSGTKSSNFSDGGTLARVFGTLLTAMQDGLEGVTIIATANNITQLPPEFIRRFNEVFFVDLPGPEERWEILGIHLGKRKRNLATFEADKDKILAASNNFTGAEMEKAVKDAIAASFYDNMSELKTSHLLDAFAETKPISKVMASQIKKIRDQAKGQYRFASSWSDQNLNGNKVQTNGKTLDIDQACDDMTEFMNKKPEKEEPVNVSDRFQDLD